MTTTTLILLALVAVVTPALGSRLPYIIGGTTVTNATEYPWQGSLQVFGGGHSCGCALISKTWAVTAAHCVGNSPSIYRIRFGSVTWSSGGQLAFPTNITKHEDYENGPGSFPNDIAVMKLRDVSLGSTVKAITIVSTDMAGNSDCHITGWGYTTTGGGRVSEQLQEALINVYTNDQCKRTWGNSINDGHVCIGDSANGKGSCNGDSGGPLVCKVGDDYELVGVTSWGRNGCYTTYPSVYTRLTYFRSWITEKTGV